MSLRISVFPSFIKTYIKSFQGLPTHAWAGIIISCVQSTLAGIIYFLTLYFVNFLKFSVFQAGFLISCYGAGTIFGALLGGKLSDKYSSGVICIYALFLESIAYLLMMYNHNFYFLMLNLFVTGIAAYSFITANTLWVLEKCNAHEYQRLKALNILNVASNLGLGLSALVISFLSFAEFHYLFMMTCIILSSVGLYTFILEKNNKTQRLINNEKKENKQIDYHHKIILYVLFSLFLMGIIISQTNSTYPLFLTETFPKMGMKSFSILFIINTLMVVFLQTIIVDTFQKINKVILIGVSVFTLGCSMLLLSMTHAFTTAIFAIILMTLGEIIFFSIAQSICYEKSTNDKKGQNLGFFRMTFAISRIAGPFIGGLIYQNWGGENLWYFCFTLGLVSTLPAFLLFKFV